MCTHIYSVGLYNPQYQIKKNLLRCSPVTSGQTDRQTNNSGIPSRCVIATSYSECSRNRPWDHPYPCMAWAFSRGKLSFVFVIISRASENCNNRNIFSHSPISFFLSNATSRKVSGSIPDEVIGFFNWPNHSSRTMGVGSTQLLTEMSTRNLPGCKGRLAHKADNLTIMCEPIV
jgi:hypothetical protein